MSDVPVMQPMETAPKDGTPIRLFTPYLPKWGMVHVWQYHPGTGATGWCTARGLACFEWSGWKPLPDDVLFAIAAEREACAKIADSHEKAASDQCWQTAKAIAAAIRARGDRER